MSHSREAAVSDLSCLGVPVVDSLVGTEPGLSRFKGLLAKGFKGLVAGFEGLVTVGFEGLEAAGFEGLEAGAFEGLEAGAFEGLEAAGFEGLELAGCSFFCLEGEGTSFAFSLDTGLDSLSPSFFSSTLVSSSEGES